ncbi:MAG: hypothetical protein WAM96_17325 [Candidatus Acidiferrales bacterium]
MFANLAAHVAASGTASLEKQRSIVGHVFGRVEHLTGFPTNLLGGLQYDVFIFGVSNEPKLGRQPFPVKVVYEFYRYGPYLPEKFFDFSRLYELRVVRDPTCDESVKSLSYEANATESGDQLPPTYILRLLDGAPNDVLKPDMVLPCYVLRPGRYKAVSEGKRH